ncbi:MAG: DUF5320 family protein [Candidatus Aureabacteria bacterium]|nr:DUF5320 family protein [Candidatus Auribacterota bacterium]
MPRGDGTGPAGLGPRTGRGRGRCSGSTGLVNQQATAIMGNCFCISCGERIRRQPGMPCSSIVCPKCGGKMTRE